MNNPFHLFAILFIYAVIVQSEDLHENTNMQTPAKEIIGQQPVKTEQSMTKEKTETKMPNKQTSNADKSNKAQRTKKKKQAHKVPDELTKYLNYHKCFKMDVNAMTFRKIKKEEKTTDAPLPPDPNPNAMKQFTFMGRCYGTGVQ
ncbi:unnamed protein product [Schistosoma turkestanicum]|nr:unnamed protein product [Schistosoma turkestanicum]